MARRQGTNRLERRSRRQRRPEREDVVEAARIEFARDFWIDKERFDLRSKQKPTPDHGVKQRAHADAISGQEERVRLSVPDTKRPLAVQFFDRGGPVFLEEMKDDFGIGLGTEAMAFRYEFFTNLDVIENLTVERDP